MQNTNEYPFEIVYELLIAAKRDGYIEINNGIFLSSRESIISDQKYFTDEDFYKEFNFNDDNFWITTHSGNEPIGINTEHNLSEQKRNTNEHFSQNNQLQRLVQKS